MKEIYTILSFSDLSLYGAFIREPSKDEIAKAMDCGIEEVEDLLDAEEITIEKINVIDNKGI